jgi:ATP-dependent DNA helicase RecQ
MSTPKAPESYLPRFGLTSFRQGQEAVISTVLSGRDCLCVMPTGGGKSLCYQLPAIALDGLTLVVSPLIALMKDQVDQLQALGLPVSFINSTLPVAEQYARLDRLATGEFRLVYVVPERFRSGRFLEAVQGVGIKLLAVDEAHCISEWGHDFRPDYARLGYFRRLLGNPTTIALTATATDRVRRDIVEQLSLRDPETFITGFARPNLFYEVQSPRSERQKPEILAEFLRQTPGVGIIYASTRKRAEEVADQIAEDTKRRTVVYHAGLLPDQRRAAQDHFMKGRCEIVVATNAFGMGIDKADVRFVVHYNIPGSLEAYYQEAGRAGRDGKPSRCFMLYHPSDRYIQEYFIESAYPGRENVQAVYEFLCGRDENPIELTQDDIKATLGLPIGSDGVGNCEQLLESAGVLERLIASQNLATVRIDSDLPTLVDFLPKQAKTQRKVLQAVERIIGARRQELVQFNFRDLSGADEFDQASITYALRELNRLEPFTYVPPFRGRAIRMIRRDLPFEELEIDFAALERRKALELEKLNRVISFALSGACRQREILRYFGEQDAQRCGHCDNCRQHAPQATAETRAAYAEDDRLAGRVLEAVVMVLSGVARTEARFPCGKNLIAQMLCGSGNAKMSKLRLDKLSTFGLLKHLRQPDVTLMIDALVALRCLEQVEPEPFRPVVQLTEFGREVMKGHATLDVALPLPLELLRKLKAGRKGESGNAEHEKGEGGRGKAENASPPSPFPLPRSSTPVPPSQNRSDDAEILEALRRWRKDIAEEAGLPPHYILNNDTLAELAQRRPRTQEELLTVKGIGPVKAERFGISLLEIIATAAEQDDRTEAYTKKKERGHDEEAADQQGDDAQHSSPAVRPSSSAPISHPSHYWSWRLLSAGFSVEDCASIRGLSCETILEHARQAQRELEANGP